MGCNYTLKVAVFMGRIYKADERHLLQRPTGKGRSRIPLDQTAVTGPSRYLVVRFDGKCECLTTCANSLLLITLLGH